MFRGATVSTVHASFVKRGDAWSIVPGETTNGTYLNEDRLEPRSVTPLQDGAIVAFGPEVRAQFFSPRALHELIKSRIVSAGERR